MGTNRPEAIPRWATDVGATVVEPGSGQKDDGWAFGDIPPEGFENWLNLKTYQWFVYGDQLLVDLLAPGPYAGLVVSHDGLGVFSVTAGALQTSLGIKLNADAAPNFNSGSPASPSTGSTRIDAVVLNHTPGDNTFSFAVVEGFTTLAANQYALAFVSVDDNATYTVLALAQTGRLGEVNNRLVIGDGDTAQGDVLDTVNTAITALNRAGGGVLEMVGDQWLNRIETDQVRDGIPANNFIHAQSRVRLVGTKSSIGETGNVAQALVVMKGENGGGANVSITATGALLADSGQVISGPGIGSEVVISGSGVGNDGTYMVKRIVDDTTVELVDTNFASPSLTDESGPGPDFVISLTDFSVENFTVEDGGIITIETTKRCDLLRVSFVNPFSAFSVDGPITINGDNEELSIIRCGTRGQFTKTLKVATTGANRNWIIKDNVWDGGPGFDGDVEIFSTDPNPGIYTGNRMVQGGGTETLPTGMGWRGVVETLEHNPDGSHKNDIIDTAELVAGAVDETIASGAVARWSAGSKITLAAGVTLPTASAGRHGKIVLATPATDEFLIAFVSTGVVDVTIPSGDSNVQEFQWFATNNETLILLNISILRVSNTGVRIRLFDKADALTDGSFELQINRVT